MIDRVIMGLAEYYRYIAIDMYVVMPNHVHMIIEITSYVGNGLCPSTDSGW